MRAVFPAVLCSLVAAGCPSAPPDEGDVDAGPGGSSGPPPFVIVDAGPRDEGDAGPGDDAGVPCVDDDAEDNDTQATATTLQDGASRSARFCGGDDDWFAVDVDRADCSVAVTLVADASGDDGAVLDDLDLLLVDADGAVVGTASGVGEREALNVRTGAAGRYAARVRGGARDDVGYTITAAVTCGDDQVCPADDGGEDNDDAATPAALDLGVPTDAAVCGGDDDYWSIPTTPGCFANVTATFVDARGDVDLFLVDVASGADLASSRGTSDREQIVRVLQDPGTVVARVELFQGSDPNVGNAYRLTVDEICEGELACPGDDPAEDNDTRQTAATIGRDDRTLGIVCGSDEDFFRVAPQAGCTTTMRVAFVDADGDIDIELLDGAGNTLQASRGSTNEEVVTHAADNTAAVVLRVFGFGAAQNRYRLTTSTTCP